VLESKESQDQSIATWEAEETQEVRNRSTRQVAVLESELLNRDPAVNEGKRLLHDSLLNGLPIHWCFLRN